MRKYLAAVIQMDTQADKEANLAAACGFIDEAAGRGAKLVSLPEVFSIIEGGRFPPEELAGGRTIPLMAAKAREHGIWLHCGSIAEVIPGEERSYNTTVLLNPKGEIAARYRKLHTFDITLPDGRKTSESKAIKPGGEIVTLESELGHFGFSICYDIRFPELYRAMALRGAQIIFTPANFALATGKDHWEVLLRARAVENGCYIVAAGQIGKKERQPDAFGASMIVDPWGTVLCRGRETPGVSLAEIDLDYLDEIRRRLPMLAGRRSDVYDTIIK